MRQQCDSESGHTPAAAWAGKIPEPNGENERIDLERVIWDLEYREQVLRSFRSRDKVA